MKLLFFVSLLTSLMASNNESLERNYYSPEDYCEMHRQLEERGVDINIIFSVTDRNTDNEISTLDLPVNMTGFSGTNCTESQETDWYTGFSFPTARLNILGRIYLGNSSMSNSIEFNKRSGNPTDRHYFSAPVHSRGIIRLRVQDIEDIFMRAGFTNVQVQTDNVWSSGSPFFHFYKGNDRYDLPYSITEFDYGIRGDRLAEAELNGVEVVLAWKSIDFSRFVFQGSVQHAN